MTLALFYGTFMRGGAGHGALAGARFLEQVQTAPRYRLFSIGDAYPALVASEADGAAIAGELYEVPDESWTRILALEPPELRRELVELSDGRMVEAMLADEAIARANGLEITSFGGWAAYRAASR